MSIEQAIKILESIYQGCEDVIKDQEAHKDAVDLARLVKQDCRKAIKEALAQPEQEPVAWYYEIDGSKAISFAKDGEPNKPWQGLYTQPDPDALHAAYMSGFYDGKKA